MKKIILCVIGVLLIAALLAAVVWFGSTLSGSHTEPPTTTEPSATAPTQTDPSGTTSPSASTSPSSEATQPVDIHIETPMVSISLPILVETDTADDGTVIFTRTFQDVVLNIPDADITKTVTLDLLRRMDANSSVLSAVQSSAYADYAGQEGWSPYYYEILYSAARIDQTVLSLYGVEDIYSASQSGRDKISVSYDLLTGSVLKLHDVLTEESTAADRLLSALLAALGEMEEAYMLYDDYADTVTGLFQSYLQQESGWYFTSDGLSFFFSPYDIAPNSSGFVTAAVPYSELNGILRETYFPAEQVDFPGGITAVPFDSAELDSFSHFSELVLDPDAPRYLLYTDGVVYGLRIDLITSDAGDPFNTDPTIFAANLISPDDALVLRAVIPEINCTLLLRCRSGGSDYCFNLALDPATETIVFTPAG